MAKLIKMSATPVSNKDTEKQKFRHFVRLPGRSRILFAGQIRIRGILLRGGTLEEILVTRRNLFRARPIDFCRA